MTRLRRWKYPDNEDMPRHECYDCGLDYGCDAWVDVIVPNDIWERINPTPYEGGGLLCFHCMTRRIVFLGLEDVQVDIKSGPYCLGE